MPKIPGSSSAETLQRVALEWMDRVWRRHEIDAIDELHAPDFVDRSAAGRGADNASYKRGIADFYSAFPDWSADTEDLIVDVRSGTVALRWSATGMHAATYLGVAPTQRRIKFQGIEILRIEDGRIVERWGEWDGLGLLAQLRGGDPDSPG